MAHLSNLRNLLKKQAIGYIVTHWAVIWSPLYSLPNLKGFFGMYSEVLPKFNSTNNQWQVAKEVLMRHWFSSTCVDIFL